MANDRACLVSMRECLTRIEHYVAGGRGAFMNSPLIQDAVLWNLQLLCATTLKVSDALKCEHRQIDWWHLSGLFRSLAHDPWHVELETVWLCIEGELPAIRQGLAGLLRPTTGQHVA
jgi:uncharacterized protein with HEPN domain